MKSSDEARVVAERLNADIYFLSGPINQEAGERFYDIARRPSERHSNALLIFASSSGELESCYRIARLLQRNYDSVTLMLIGRCGGIAGFMALVCDDIAMSDFGEFSPLDMTLISQNEQLLQAYASRLNTGYEDILSTLSNAYPTPDFIIDLQEAADIFGTVRPLEDDEYAVADTLLKQFPEVRYLNQQESHIECLSAGFGPSSESGSQAVTPSVSTASPSSSPLRVVIDEDSDSSSPDLDLEEDAVNAQSEADEAVESKDGRSLRGSKDANRDVSDSFGKKDESRRRSRENK